MIRILKGFCNWFEISYYISATEKPLASFALAPMIPLYILIKILLIEIGEGKE